MLNTLWLRTALSLFVMTMIPPALCVLLLSVSRDPRWSTTDYDLAILALCVAIGVAGLWSLRLSRGMKWVLLVPYLVALAAGLIWLSLLFVCVAFGACL